ncbi:uncharacterized protein LOC134815816 [Bolinopsis microptera]|uniref:uncharacterized protein LOC134815816 n=1 Tax=Bolinopsis microptera TaxID=2820187 RepID=UPI00307AF2A6
MLLLLVVLVLVASVQPNEDDKGYNALHFGTSNSDYVTFRFDISPFRNSFSTCMWIKRIYTSSSYPMVADYYSSGGNDLIITANGAQTCVVHDGGLSSASSKFATPTGKWFNLCLTWSLSSTTSNLYLDGELVATDQTASGKSLTAGGQLWFGRASSTWTNSASRVFGGELYQYNMFAEVLSAATIRKIADGGLCFDLDGLSETRVLRWVDIMKKSRSGSVTDTDTGCKKTLNNTRESQANLNETETELRMIKEQFETLTGQYETVTGQLNRTEDKLETETGRFNESQAELDTVRGRLGAETAELNQTVEELETCSVNLNKTKSQLDGARKFENITRWDVLFTAPYYNKVFSDDLYEELTTGWDMLRKLVGVNMTDGVVNHFREYHSESMCGVFDHFSSFLEILSQFIGVEMTKGIVEHFRESYNGAECDNNTKS